MSGETPARNPALDPREPTHRAGHDSPTHRLVGWAALAVVALGTVVLAGWALDITALTSISSQWVSMKPNAALGFVLCGAVLWQVRTAEFAVGSRANRAAKVLALVVIALGAVTTAEYFFGWDAGIDQLLFQERAGRVATSHPGRMAPNTALSFIACGAALLVLLRNAERRERRRTLRISESMAAIVALVGAIAILSYAAGVEIGHRSFPYTGKALHTAAGFLVLGIAIIAEGWRRERVSWVIGGLTTTVFAAGTGLLVGLVGAAYRTTADMERAGDAVAAAYELQLATTELALADRDASAASRSYALAGRSFYLTRFDTAALHATQNAASLRGAAALNPDLRTAADSLALLVEARLAFDRQIIAAQDRGGRGAAERVLNTGRGAALTDAIRALTNAVIARQDQLIRERQDASSAANTRVFAMLPLAGVFGAGTLTLVLLGMNREVGRRQRAVIEARNSAEQFRAVFEQAAIGVALVAPDGRILRANEALCAIVGRSREELEHLRFSDFTHPDDVGADWELIRSVLAGEITTYTREKRYLRCDGSIVWANVTASLVRRDGKSSYFISAIQDITARHHAEEAARESDERFALAVEAAEMGTYDWDVQHDRIIWSRRHEELWGFAPGEFGGTYASFAERVHPEDMAGVNAAVARCVAERRPFSREFRVVQPGGNTIWVAARGEFTFAADGTPVTMRGVVVETTARRMAEEAVLRLNAELERRVEQRTAQLEAANKELEAFSYSVSHDLRAPLRAIDGYGRMLTEDHGGALDAEAKRLLGVITGETRRMGQLIDDLLAFSRLGRHAMQPTTVDMTALARSVFDEQLARTPDRHVRLELKALCPAHGDPALLRIALGNLVSNALKFTAHSAAAAVTIGCRADGGAQTYYVKDNGVGFDPAYAHKLFGIFQRLHSTSEFEGTGVGLALVQRVVNRHGGRVWADGRLGEGATFSFSLPEQGGTT